jgi:hypothetical protein
MGGESNLGIDFGSSITFQLLLQERRSLTVPIRKQYTI